MNDATFDDFVRPLDYPMYVLTVPGSDGTDRSGCLIGFTTQCSISPPKFLACLSKANHTYRCAAHARIAAVHLLGPDNHKLAALFGTQTGDEVDKFESCGWTEGPEGVPILSGCAGWFVGTIDGRVDLGDHEGLLLGPTRISPPAPGRPLMFSGVRDLDAGHPA